MSGRRCSGHCRRVNAPAWIHPLAGAGEGLAVARGVLLMIAAYAAQRRGR